MVFSVVRNALEQGASTTLDAAPDLELSLQEDVMCHISPAKWYRDMKGYVQHRIWRLWAVSEELAREECG